MSFLLKLSPILRAKTEQCLCFTPFPKYCKNFVCLWSGAFFDFKKGSESFYTFKEREQKKQKAPIVNNIEETIGPLYIGSLNCFLSLLILKIAAVAEFFFLFNFFPRKCEPFQGSPVFLIFLLLFLERKEGGKLRK